MIRRSSRLIFTNSQRLRIYKYALSKIENNEKSYICDCIWLFVNKEYGIFLDSVEVRRQFPEFSSQRPKKLFDREIGSWWSIKERGRRKRIEVLNKCIESTKPKSNAH